MTLYSDKEADGVEVKRTRRQITEDQTAGFPFLCLVSIFLSVNVISAQENFMPLELDRLWIYNYIFYTENLSEPPGDLHHEIEEYHNVSSLDFINSFHAYKVNTWQEDSSWVGSEWYVQNDSGLFTVAYSYWSQSPEPLRLGSSISFHDRTFGSFQELYRFLLYSSNPDTTLFEPPRALLKYPLVKDSSWVWFTDPWYATRISEGSETIQTPSGLFDCTRIRVDYDIDGDGEIDTGIVFQEWWSVNVGLVERDISLFNIVEKDEEGDSIGVYNAYTVWELIGNEILNFAEEPNSSLESPRIFSAYPNPFNPATTIEFSVAQGGLVTLTVYDLLGREVETILNRHMSPGHYQVQWNATNVPSGIYFVRMQAGGFTEVRRVTVLK